mmetsp:Transcript_37193/g.43269  ORF Transcript_37193/g.43269 Transcript_37193/m.43269 type:complete len:812 (+) Transcript_37193:245-2680(+)
MRLPLLLFPFMSSFFFECSYCSHDFNVEYNRKKNSSYIDKASLSLVSSSSSPPPPPLQSTATSDDLLSPTVSFNATSEKYQQEINTHDHPSSPPTSLDTTVSWHGLVIDNNDDMDEYINFDEHNGKCCYHVNSTTNAYKRIIGSSANIYEDFEGGEGRAVSIRQRYFLMKIRIPKLFLKSTNDNLSRHGGGVTGMNGGNRQHRRNINTSQDTHYHAEAVETILRNLTTTITTSNTSFSMFSTFFKQEEITIEQEQSLGLEIVFLSHKQYIESSHNSVDTDDEYLHSSPCRPRRRSSSSSLVHECIALTIDHDLSNILSLSHNEEYHTISLLAHLHQIQDDNKNDTSSRSSTAWKNHLNSTLFETDDEYDDDDERLIKSLWRNNPHVLWIDRDVEIHALNDNSNNDDDDNAIYNDDTYYNDDYHDDGYDDDHFHHQEPKLGHTQGGHFIRPEEKSYGIRSVQAHRVSAYTSTPQSPSVLFHKNNTSTLKNNTYFPRIRQYKNQQMHRNRAPITLCIVDSGLLATHEDLPQNASSITGTSGPQGAWNADPFGHGTHITGIIGALGHNRRGIFGLIPHLDSSHIHLHIVRGIDDWGRGRMSHILAASLQCRRAGADIVNLSLGCRGEKCYVKRQEQLFADMYRSSYDSSMLLFAASGNAGTNEKTYPASYKTVVSVGAVGPQNKVTKFSQYNDQVELVAPGKWILSLDSDGQTNNNNNLYSIKSGTSMAVPFASGAAALVWSNYPKCTAEEIRNVLIQTALDRKTQKGCDSMYGFGVVQVKDAVDYLERVGGCDGVKIVLSGMGGCSIIDYENN